MSKRDLASLLGVTRQTLDNYIKGKQVIDSSKLAVLAQGFNKPMDFFLSPAVNRGASLLYRAERAADTPDHVIASILRRFELYAELLQLTQRKSVFHPPTYTVKLEGQLKLSESDERLIEEVAGKTRMTLGLDGVTGHDVFYALEGAGINILAFPTDPQAEAWGASAYSVESGAFI
jgi:transcriptional regulator with XRE-family HTH domain